ncbi:MAG: hypothetical protein WC856_01660 [Methylococcaceae bacterium]
MNVPSALDKPAASVASFACDFSFQAGLSGVALDITVDLFMR